jgi:hypothetical protein
METALKMEKASMEGQRPRYKFTEEEKQAYIDALGTNWLAWDRKQCEEYVKSKNPEIKIKAVYRLATIEQFEYREA